MRAGVASSEFRPFFLSREVNKSSCIVGLKKDYMNRIGKISAQKFNTSLSKSFGYLKELFTAK